MTDEELLQQSENDLLYETFPQSTLDFFWEIMDYILWLREVSGYNIKKSSRLRIDSLTCRLKAPNDISITNNLHEQLSALKNRIEMKYPDKQVRVTWGPTYQSICITISW